MKTITDAPTTYAYDVSQDTEDYRPDADSLIQSLDDAHDLIAELRAQVAERDTWLNAAAATIERYAAKFGPLSEL